jgi:hypothetical protein
MQVSTRGGGHIKDLWELVKAKPYRKTSYNLVDWEAVVTAVTPYSDFLCIRRDKW